VLFLCPKTEKGGNIHGMEDTPVAAAAGEQVSENLMLLL
jgi:hypothetical protein